MYCRLRLRESDASDPRSRKRQCNYRDIAGDAAIIGVVVLCPFCTLHFEFCTSYTPTGFITIPVASFGKK
jgi:hypothetical protein